MPATVVGTIVQNGVKYRLIKNASDTPTPIVEKCLGADCWQRLTPQSEPTDIWNALQAALTRI